MTDTPTLSVVSEAEAEAPVAAKAPQAPRRRGIYDLANGTVTVTEPGVEIAPSYSFKTLPPAVQSYIALHGLWMIMRAATTPAEGYAALVNGQITTPKVAAVEPLSDWKKAVAATLVELSKKHGLEMTQEQAEERAAGLDRAAMAKARLDPMVIRHHNKLVPVTGGSSLISLVVPPAVAAAAAA